jgi:putative transcriptional regulator
MTTHHAPDEMLLAYATGSLNTPLSLMVETHAAYSDDSQHRLRDYEAIGGALLESLEPAPLRSGALDALPPEAETAEPLPRSEDGFDLPPALRKVVGSDVGALAWKPMMRGVAEADLDLDEGGRARLLRIEAGTTVPRHSHRGNEFTLVLSGAYRDSGSLFGPGDLQIADPAVDHRPQAVGERPCLCLVVTDAPLRLTGPLGQFLNPFLKNRL